MEVIHFQITFLWEVELGMSTKGFLIDGVFDLYKQFYKLSQNLFFFLFIAYFGSCMIWKVY